MLKVCEICEDTEACIEVKHYENGEFRELSLCADCAQKHGLALPGNLTDLLLESTLKEVKASPPDVSVSASEIMRRCPVCRLRLSDFHKTGRLGCAACYDAWADVLEPMLLGMHRSLVYKGSTPYQAPGETGGIRQALLQAVACEDYEEAARLRDCLRREEIGRDAKQGEFSFDESR